MNAPQWPTGQAAWKAYAARCISHYPLMGTDWDQHHEIMKARRNKAIQDAIDAVPDEAPLSPEDEESLPEKTSSTLF